MMRCLTLADELNRQGCSVRFVSVLMPSELVGRAREAGYDLDLIQSFDSGAGQPGWDRAAADAGEQLRDAAATLQAVAASGADWIVVDSYRLDETWERETRTSGAKLLVIDDLANRPHDCDILVDQTLGRDRSDYSALVPSHCTILAGSRYALLRPEFAAARPRSLLRRRKGGPVENLLISLGATDIGGATAPILDAMLGARVDCSIDVVLGANAPSLAHVEMCANRDSRVRLHVARRNMADLTASADLAIGAAGTSSWERCCLGIPSVLLMLAENQQLVGRKLGEAGAAIAVSRWEDTIPAALRLMEDSHARALMSAAAAAVIDGRGAGEVADAVTGARRLDDRTAELRIRAIAPADIEPVWLWRNDPVTRAVAKTHVPISWQAHETWFRKRLGDNDGVSIIGEVAGEAVGIVRFDRLPDRAYLVSINLAPRWRGRGIGAQLLARACDHFESTVGRVVLKAEIRHGNAASERIFAANGFKSTRGELTKGYGIHVRSSPPKGDEFKLASWQRSFS